MVESLFELRELAEDNLLANPAGTAPDQAALRSLTARRRLVELAARNANRMQVAVRDGFHGGKGVWGTAGQLHGPDGGRDGGDQASVKKGTEAAKKR
jgi:hypothetical protein